MNQKKIILISSYTPSLINFRFNLMKDLQNQNFKVFCFGPDSDELTLEKLKENNIEFELYPLNRNTINPFGDLKTIVFLRKKMKEIKPDFIIPYTIKPVIYSNMSIRGLAVKSISLITGLGFYALPSNSLKEKIAKFIITVLYKIGTTENVVYAFQNKDDIRFFKNKKILKPKIKYCITPGSGVDLKKFKYFEPVVNPISFLFIGRLLKAKGVDVFLKSAEILKKKYPKVVFTIIGMPDPLNSDSVSEESLQNFHNRGIINYVGAVNNVIPYFEKSSVFVLPSYYREGVPRTLLEALAKGRPIITTNHVGCKETVIENENGFLIKSNSLESLLDAQEKFISNPSMIKKFGLASRFMAVRKFDVKIVNKVLMNHLKTTPVR